jgi:hypothetical protein
VSDGRYIVPRNWANFQNADVWKKSGGRPPWIKLYHRLLDNDDYLALTPKRQSILVGIWMLYARKGRPILEHTASISRALGQRVSSADLEALSNAGFIEVLSRDAREPLATRSEKTEIREETSPGSWSKDQPDPDGGSTPNDSDLSIPTEVYEFMREHGIDISSSTICSNCGLDCRNAGGLSSHVRSGWCRQAGRIQGTTL